MSASAAEKASAYSFGPGGPTRRQREEMQRRQEQARKQDRVKTMVQAALMGLAGLILILWLQWMR